MIAVIKDEYSRAIYATMIVDTSIYKNVNTFSEKV
jgi:hypothetical protein